MNGSYTPRTLPVGGEETREVSPRSLAEALLVRTSLTIWQKIVAWFVFWGCGSCITTPLLATVEVDNDTI